MGIARGSFQDPPARSAANVEHAMQRGGIRLFRQWTTHASGHSAILNHLTDHLCVTTPVFDKILARIILTPWINGFWHPESLLLSGRASSLCPHSGFVPQTVRKSYYAVEVFWC